MSDLFKPKTKNPLRCICLHAPLLAYYGLNSKDEIYLHVLVRKQSRIFCEVLVETPGAEVKLHCRECRRWTRIRLRGHRDKQAIDYDVSAPIADPTPRPLGA